MPSKLRFVKQKVENILIATNRSSLPIYFFSLPYRFFVLKESNVKYEFATVVDGNNYDVDLDVDVIVCDSYELLSNCIAISKNLNCKLIYLRDINENRPCFGEVIEVTQTQRQTTNMSYLIFPSDEYEKEIPLKKKYNLVYTDLEIPNKAPKGTPINQCSILLSDGTKEIDYDIIHAMGCGTLVLTLKSSFSETFLNNFNSIVSDDINELISFANYFLSHPEKSKDLRLNAINDYRTKFDIEIYHKRWIGLLNEC